MKVNDFPEQISQWVQLSMQIRHDNQQKTVWFESELCLKAANLFGYEILLIHV